ncbi:MAG: ATP-dependent 6-phosphofructokinase [Verrucomicrobia bacterium]|nr:ATP-dependent 6-phosphofructokinase [Verrucomicrobiota bacterium]
MIYEDVLTNPDNFNFSVPTLGECLIDSPVMGRIFVDDSEAITFASQIKNINALKAKTDNFPAFQKAGPRKKIFHQPVKTRIGIVSCGGLCPGINNVIKGLVSVLWNEYGIHSCLGFKYGYKGLLTHKPVELTPQIVDQIHTKGGSILGSSRGEEDAKKVVDVLVRNNINVLFCIGGDGTMRGAHELVEEILLRKLPISIIGIPKTIDNDLRFVEKTFGFETAVHVASEVVSSAHIEAEGAENGISIIKLMGRESGFIAAATALANSVVDFCLVPEMTFTVKALCRAVQERLLATHHAVIVVAEGVKLPGQSGDIGHYLKEELAKACEGAHIKYFEPGYFIRSVPANSSDAIFCYLLSEHAVHAAMAGKTGIVIGQWNNYFTHVPFTLALKDRRKVDLEGAMWKGVVTATRQNLALS